MCITALKIPKIFLNIFYREDPTFYTAFGEASGKGGAFYVKHGSQVCTRVLEMGLC
jgi:hypothetical protein